MARRRPTEIMLNFDSLTDLVTNLAGGLILLVLLLFITTRGTALQTRDVADEQQPPPDSNAEALERELKALKDILDGLEAERGGLQQKVNKARNEVYAYQPQDAADPEGQPGQPALVELRPPMLKDTDLSTRTVFVLIHEKVYWLDWRGEYLHVYINTLNDLRSRVNNGRDLKPYQSGRFEPLQRGDFDVRFTARVNRDVITFRGTLEPKAGARGESAEQALDATSNYRARIDEINLNDEYVSFYVYPDSFELFRTVREIVFERKVQYNWTPQNAGEELSLAPGRGGTQ